MIDDELMETSTRLAPAMPLGFAQMCNHLCMQKEIYLHIVFLFIL